MAGATLMAPGWKHEADGAGGQDVRIVFASGEPSSVTWRRDGTTYYEATGAGLKLAAGFTIVVVDSDRVESYTYSAGTTELLFTSSRVGNHLLPNSIKAFRGICVPDGR